MLQVSEGQNVGEGQNVDFYIFQLPGRNTLFITFIQKQTIA